MKKENCYKFLAVLYKFGFIFYFPKDFSESKPATLFTDSIQSEAQTFNEYCPDKILPLKTTKKMLNKVHRSQFTVG
jgi:hypothetical protein